MYQNIVWVNIEMQIFVVVYKTQSINSCFKHSQCRPKAHTTMFGDLVCQRVARDLFHDIVRCTVRPESRIYINNVWVAEFFQCKRLLLELIQVFFKKVHFITKRTDDIIFIMKAYVMNKEFLHDDIGVHLIGIRQVGTLEVVVTSAIRYGEPSSPYRITENQAIPPCQLAVELVG